MDAVSDLKFMIHDKIKLDLKLNKINKLLCDENSIKQVIIHIVRNAIQAINEQGEIIIMSKMADNKIQIEISDNGSGIDKEHYVKIFDPFFTTKDIGKGLGLGLSLSHNIIDAYNGAITFESILGKGSTFIISINPEESDFYKVSLF